MKIRLILIIIFLFCLGNCTDLNKKKPPKAVKGVLDLTQWNFEKDGTINLDGEWEFYWKEFVPPDSLPMENEELKIKNGKNSSFLIHHSSFITVPGSWNKQIINNVPIDGDGYATYRIKVLLGQSQRELSFKIPQIHTSYQLYINGNLIAQAGKIGKSKTEADPYFLSKIVSTSVSKELEILLYISNFVHRRGGLRNSIIIGEVGDLHKIKDTAISFDLLLAGALFIMGLYHFGLYGLRRKEPSPLYFGIFCILMQIRVLCTGENYLLTTFSNLPFELPLRMEYLPISVGPIVFLLYMNSLYTELAKKIILQIEFVFGFALTLVCLFAPIKILSSALIFNQINLVLVSVYVMYVVILAIGKKRSGGKIFLAGIIIFSCAIFLDILSYEKILDIPFVTPYGFFFFILSQAYLLSARFSHAFIESEEQRLIASNARLEIEKLSKSKDEFLANLSHEIKTPLSIVYAYSEMLSTGKDYPDKVKRYSENIYENSQILNNYVNDLLLVTDIESNLHLQKCETDICALITKTIESLKQLTNEREIKLEFVGTPGGASAIQEINCDPILLEKAISAILKNAIVYNNIGGKIMVGYAYMRNPQHANPQHDLIQITITDTGIGIAKEFHEKIFEKFVRVDSTLTYEVSGVGVGLFIAKKIIELHGGSIDVKSELGQGSEFTINLPVNTDKQV
jgi:two-component system sensor histidine kinase ChiS